MAHPRGIHLGQKHLQLPEFRDDSACHFRVVGLRVVRSSGFPVSSRPVHLVWRLERAWSSGPRRCADRPTRHPWFGDFEEIRVWNLAKRTDTVGWCRMELCIEFKVLVGL